VIRAPGPVLTEYLHPWERLVFAPKRDANHVFHLMETIWMLAGERDVRWLLQFNKDYGQYAEEDGVQHGAYGSRWRRLCGKDQIFEAVRLLRVNPYDRRVVISMWSPSLDLGENKRDLPCNTHIYFDCIGRTLSMTVCCRSNDIIWGAYGANAVHFSMLHELIATASGLTQGKYYQMSNNFHLYTQMGQGAELLRNPPMTDPYDVYKLSIPLLNPGESLSTFTADCEHMVQGRVDMGTSFMRNVAMPLHNAYLARKAGMPWADFLDRIPECDWKLAFTEWVARRENNVSE
jgi:thymidylate synthase